MMQRAPHWAPLSPLSPLLGGGALRIGPDDHGVGDRDYLVDRQPGQITVLADRLLAGRLVDADRADRAAVFIEDVAANPAHVVGHLLAGPGRALGRLLQLLWRLPAAPPEDRVCVHSPSSGCRARPIHP